MEASTLVSLFGDESGTPLKLGPSGTLDLVFNDGPTVTLEHDDVEDTLHVYVVVGQEPPDTAQRYEIYQAMLNANVFGHETGGAQLGRDDITGELLLTQRLFLPDANVAALRRAVERAVHVARVWRDKLSGPVSAAPGSASVVPIRPPEAPLPAGVRA
jgi:hypothetical protein